MAVPKESGRLVHLLVRRDTGLNSTARLGLRENGRDPIFQCLLSVVGDLFLPLP